MSNTAFITGFPANTLLVGTGKYTNGIVLSVEQVHMAGQPTLQGKFTIIANHSVAHNLLTEHLPTHQLINSENTFGRVRASILEEVGIQGNAHVVNNNLFHPDQWTAHLQPNFSAAEPKKRASRMTDKEKAERNKNESDDAKLPTFGDLVKKATAVFVMTNGNVEVETSKGLYGFFGKDLEIGDEAMSTGGETTGGTKIQTNGKTARQLCQEIRQMLE